jgi:hypothetical protein
MSEGRGGKRGQVHSYGKAGLWANTAFDMSGFKEHFLDKYFSYRTKYVLHIEGAAPRRATLAIASEMARLCFVCLGSGFCALLFWLLTGAAWQRGGLALVFGLCAALGTWFACLALWGFIQALIALIRYRKKRADDDTGL